MVVDDVDFTSSGLLRGLMGFPVVFGVRSGQAEETIERG